MARSASVVIWQVLQMMKSRHYWHPAELARKLSFTRAEVELALWYLRKTNEAVRRFDGRWFLLSEGHR